MVRTGVKEPWLHAASGWWCTKIDGKQVYLAQDLRRARIKLNRILAAVEEFRRPGRLWLDRLLRQLCKKFLRDTKQRRKPNTYENYRYMLKLAMRCLPKSLCVGDVGKRHLRRIERKLAGKCSSTTVHSAIAVFQRIFAWAVEEELLDPSPVTIYRKPPKQERMRVATADEFQSLLRNSNAAFRRVLMAVRQSGCRPGEVRTLSRECVDEKRGVWVLPEHKSRTTRKKSRPLGSFVITSGLLSEVVPIENAAMPERTVIQWDKDDIDALGILKVDCLGLGMLTAIHKCFDLVHQHHV